MQLEFPNGKQRREVPMAQLALFLRSTLGSLAKTPSMLIRLGSAKRFGGGRGKRERERE